MIDKIFPHYIYDIVPFATTDHLLKYIDECKERYKQFHPEEEKKSYLENPFVFMVTQMGIEGLQRGECLSFYIPRSGECVRIKPIPTLPLMTKQEAKPHKCPICEGRGFIFHELMLGYKIADNKDCHGCNGKGWVIC